MKVLSIIVILLAMVSIANADLVLTVNGLDMSKPVEIETKANIIIAVTGQTGKQKQSYSVTCENPTRSQKSQEKVNICLLLKMKS